MVYDVRASEAARESGGERSLRLFSDGASAAPSLGETRINYCTSSAKPSVGPDQRREILFSYMKRSTGSRWTAQQMRNISVENVLYVVTVIRHDKISS